MQKVGRISTAAASKGAEHASHPGVNAGKVEKFKYAMDYAHQESGGSGQDDASGRGEADSDHRDGERSASSYIIVR